MYALNYGRRAPEITLAQSSLAPRTLLACTLWDGKPKSPSGRARLSLINRRAKADSRCTSLFRFKCPQWRVQNERDKRQRKTKKWREVIYKIFHILNCGFWNQVSYDHRSYERNLSNCVQKPEKVSTSTGFEPFKRFVTVWRIKTNSCGSARPFSHGKVRLYPWEVCVLCVTSIATIKLPMGNHYGYIKNNKRITHDVSWTKW